MLETNRAFLACAKCEQRICDIRSIKERVGGIGQKITPSDHDICTNLPFNQSDPYCNLSFFEKILLYCGTYNYQLFGCKNGHILGFRKIEEEEEKRKTLSIYLQQEWFITAWSDLLIIYPDVLKSFSFYFFLSLKPNKNSILGDFLRKRLSRRKKKLII